VTRSSMGRRRIVTAAEQDVHTHWRRLYIYTSRAGVCKRIKRSTNRRERREGRAQAWGAVFLFIVLLAAGACDNVSQSNSAARKVRERAFATKVAAEITGSSVYSQDEIIRAGKITCTNLGKGQDPETAAGHVPLPALGRPARVRFAQIAEVQLC
jgi:hypothetical protein